jgi:hypothetical protein
MPTTGRSCSATADARLLAINLVGEVAAHGRLGHRDRMQSLVDEAMAVAGENVIVAGLTWGLCRAELSRIDENRRAGLAQAPVAVDEQPGRLIRDAVVVRSGRCGVAERRPAQTST